MRAAEVIASRGLRVVIFDQKPSPGRKFLVAGRGGLNITHSEPIEDFVRRYDAPEQWRRLLKRFSPDDFRKWFHKLGIETFVGTSGRVFPKNIRIPAVLEKWVERLNELECDMRVGRRFHQMLGQRPFEIVFQCGSNYELVSADAVVFALGSACWPQTGSDARWVEEFNRLGVRVSPFIPSNVGWERTWSKKFLDVAEGKPLKNLAISCNGRVVKGELMITKYGLEGGGLYQLTRDLRYCPEIEIDFRPSLSEADLRAKLRTASDKNPGHGIRRNWRLTDAVSAVIEEIVKPKTLEDWIRGVKHCRLTLDRPRPIEEAISCGGGVPWGELTPDLMLRAVPGAFCAGEMVDWDAPTGGYLLQGCLATATVAGEGVVKWIAQHVEP